MLFILDLDCLWESGFIQAASLDHLDEVLTLVFSLPWREREKGQLCNFENYKKKKGVQGEIYVGAWSKSPNCYCYFWSHNMSNLHCTRTNQEKLGSTNMLDLFIFGTELYCIFRRYWMLNLCLSLYPLQFKIPCLLLYMDSKCVISRDDLLFTIYQVFQPSLVQ